MSANLSDSGLAPVLVSWSGRKSRIWTGVVAFGVFGLLAYALTSQDRYGQSMAVWISLNSVLAVALRFVLLIGEKNVATAAFMGIGAYASAIATVKLAWPFPVALLVGGASGGVSSFLFGAVTLRVKGPYFMLVSFSFTELLRLVYSQWNYVGGNSGIVGIYPPASWDVWMPALVVAFSAILILVLYLCERSSWGKLFKAIGDNDAVVASVGISILRVRLVCLVLASVAVSFAGALQAHTNNIISPADFAFSIVIFALAYIKIGGQSHILGTVVGTALLTMLDQALQGHGALEQILFGAAIVAGMLFLPDGLIGLSKQVGAFLSGVCRGVLQSGSGDRLIGRRGSAER